MRDLTRVFAALSDPTRARILQQLSRQVLCVGALAQRLGVTHSAVSQHLRILREAGLVRGQKRGYWVHYSLDGGRIRAIEAIDLPHKFAEALRKAREQVEGSMVTAGSTSRRRGRSLSVGSRTLV